MNRNSTASPPGADQDPIADSVPPSAELPNPAVYLELSVGAAMHAKIWVSRDAPDVFHAVLDLARTASGTWPPRESSKPGPIKDLIDAGLLSPGQRLTWHRRNKAETYLATVTADARLRLADGSVHNSASGAAAYIAGHPVKGWQVFTTDDGHSLAQLIASRTRARLQPGTAPPEAATP